MDYKDYYKVMGVNRNADEKEIKTAYRRLARKYHPDISKESNAEEKFKELGEAYEVLKDSKKRKVYDQYGKDWEARQHTQSSSQGAPWEEGGESYQYSHDFFESLFGGAPHFRQRPRTGQDFQGDITISLEEAYKGTEREIHIPASPMTGSGGQTIKVKVPVGVKSGQKIRVLGQGGASTSGGSAGHLYLTVHIHKHPLFDVVDKDIYLTLPIAPWEAALGATIGVPTLGGKVDLKIPAGSQGGQTLRLKNRGLPGGSKPGDQYVLLKIIIPQPKTDEAKALYKKMAELMPFNPRETLGV
jgi:curved DNA-binding protein